MPYATVTIPMKLPSLNEYIGWCRENRFKAAARKKQIESDICLFIGKLPIFSNPVLISFVWTEGNKKRDYDNVAFAKKFILDAMVKAGKLKDDNRRYVVGFVDTFRYGKTFSVDLEIADERGIDEDTT